MAYEPISVHAEVNGPMTVKVRGVIGWDVTGPALADLIGNIDTSKTTSLRLEIWSPGGLVWDGNYAVDKLRELSIPTEAHVYFAASMATVIASACDKTFFAPHAQWLVHNPYTGTEGDASAMEATAGVLRRLETEAAELYAARTGKTAAEMLALMSEARLLSAQEAIDLGFGDGFIEDADDAQPPQDLIAACIESGALLPQVAALLTGTPADTEEIDNAGAEADAGTAGHEDAAIPAGASPREAGGVEVSGETSGADDTDTAEDDYEGLYALAADHAGELSASLTAATEQVSDLTTQLATATADLAALAEAHQALEATYGEAQDELARKEAVILDCKERLAAFGAGLRGTDEDQDRAAPSADAYWAAVAAEMDAGASRNDAIAIVRQTKPELLAAMLAAANHTTAHKD